MSMQATKWVWEQALPPVQKLVLLALSDRHTGSPEVEVVPENIVHECGLESAAQFERRVSQLVRKGLIRRVSAEPYVLAFTF